MASRTPMLLIATYVSVTGLGTIHDALNKCSLAVEVEEKDKTTFASAGWKENTGGIKSGNMGLTWNADYADDGLDEKLWTIFLAGVPVAFEVRPSQDSAAVTNPKWTGLVLPKGVKMLNGGVGDLGTDDQTWPLSGAVTRATS